MVAASQSLRPELNAADKGGPEHDAQMFGQVTDLFLTSADQLNASQINAVDGVLMHLIGRVGPELLVHLSEALATMELAPRQTVRGIALHPDPHVATPVLRKSTCLSQADLLKIANSGRRRQLLAICDRKVLDEELTDALLKLGDIDVLNALAQNAGARFSSSGYANLVGRADRDESLAEKIGLRLDLPANLLRELLGKVADVVLARFLTAPRSVAKPNAEGAAATAQPLRQVRANVDYVAAMSQLVMLNRTGKLNDQTVNQFAVRGEYVNVVAALALKADAKPEAIELMLDPERLYGLIVACKAARLNWSTTTMIVRNRPGCAEVTARELDQCNAIYESLLLSLAQWTIRWNSDQLLGTTGPVPSKRIAANKVSD